MKIASIGTDLAALGIVLGAAAKFLPAIAALFGAVWYAFVIYDRIKYGPELSNRLPWGKRTSTIDAEEKDARDAIKLQNGET